MFNAKVKPGESVKPLSHGPALHRHRLPMHASGVVRQDQELAEL